MVASKEPIYDPLKLKLFCISSGAPRLFDAILDAMTDPSHSSVRIELNKKRTVVMLYQLCCSLSQKCNWYQCDHAVFLKDCHLNQQGLSAERLVGSICNRQMKSCITCHLETPEASMSLSLKQFHINSNTQNAGLTLASQVRLNLCAQLF